VQLRDGARRMLFTLGTGLALLTLAAAGNAPAALAAPAGPLSGAVPHAGAGIIQRALILPGAAGSQPAVVDRLLRPKRQPALPPLRRLLQPDLLIVAPTTLRGSITAAVRRLPGVIAAQQLDAARLQVDGKLTAMLGVNPAAFRAFAAKPTATSAGLWENVVAGGVAVSYTMGKLDKLPAGRPLRVTGKRTENLPVAGLGTVGIGGVDAVVSDAVARSLGIPAGNAIVISAPHADLTTLTKQIRRLLPRDAAIAPLVARSVSSGVPESGGVAGVTSADGPGLTTVQVDAFLRAAESRLGMPYVWGGDGPKVFDCSGLVQWSLAQAGVVMPRVAAEQALTGPEVPVSRLVPGDLLFYHTDPTAPGYISHVAIYLGDGEMIQAPMPGLDVEVVPASFGSEFAGAVAVYPRVAAGVAADPAG
jgi:cell wall-associated NlpC family hydrolase